MLIMSHRHNVTNGTEDLLIKKADTKAFSISVASRDMRGGSQLTALKDGNGPVGLGRGGLKQTRFASSSKMKNLIDEDSTAKRSLFENSHLETSGAYLPQL